MEEYGLEDCWRTDCPSCHPEVALEQEIEDLKAAIELLQFGIPYVDRQRNDKLVHRVSIAMHDRLRGLIDQRKKLTNRPS